MVTPGTVIMFLKKSLFSCMTERQGVSLGSNSKEGSSNDFMIYFKTNFILGRDVKPPKF